MSSIYGYELLILAGAVFIGGGLFCTIYVNTFLPFKEKRMYIKMEMARRHSKSSYRYWKKELKKLYLTNIPIIGFFVKRGGK